MNMIISKTYTYYPDNVVKEDVWDSIIFDERNQSISDEIYDISEKWFKPGKKYRMIIEEVLE